MLKMDGVEMMKRGWGESIRGRRSREKQRIRWRDKVKDDMEKRGLVE